MKYEATLKVLGKTVKSKGDTASEAILSLKPGTCKSSGVLTLSANGKKVEKILGAPTLFRLFNGSPTMKEIALKNVGLIFDL